MKGRECLCRHPTGQHQAETDHQHWQEGEFFTVSFRWLIPLLTALSTSMAVRHRHPNQIRFVTVYQGISVMG
jgi:hypothetical protein